MRRRVSEGSSPAPMSLLLSDHRQVPGISRLFTGHRETNGTGEHVRLVKEGMQHARFGKIAIDPVPVAYA
jgi:hypothetical protein